MKSLLQRRILFSKSAFISRKLSGSTDASMDRLRKLRNVGIVAHIDAGKTTTTENMLFIAGEIKSVGRVDTGDTVTDFLPQERERGITINSAIIELKWRGTVINLIDTPGHVDFTIEVERSCRVLDGIVLVIDAVAGVQAQTKTVWRQARKQSIPAVAFINKMDRDGASFERAVKSLRESLSINMLPIQLPITEDSNFLGVIDLISMDKITWTRSDSGNTAQPEYQKLVDADAIFVVAVAARRRMIESIAELDDVFLDLFFKYENNLQEMAQRDIVSALQRLCLAGVAVPAICGASLKGKGIQPLLDSILAFLPSPLDRPPVAARDTKSNAVKLLPASASELCALAFKVSFDEARGPLVYVRIYAGTLYAKQVLHNSTRNYKERVSQILKVAADELSGIPELGAGEVACLVGLKKTQSGDTLVIEGSPLQNSVLAGLSIPKSVFALAIEPERSNQQDDLEKALNILCLEDPSLHVDIDKESGQTLIRGIGELHLEIVCDKLLRRFKIDVSTGKAYVAFRETLAMDSEEETHEFKYDRTIGTKKLYAVLTFALRRNEEKNTPRLKFKAIQRELSPEESSALEEGFEGCVSRGPAGFPVVGFDVEVVSIERDTHTCAGSIRACMSMFLNSLLRGPSKQLLEPIMQVEVYTPTAYLGEVLSDLSTKRRGFVKEVKTDGASSVITGTVPLVTMLGYASSIRSMTQGEGSFSLDYLDHVVVDEATLKELNI